MSEWVNEGWDKKADVGPIVGGDPQDYHEHRVYAGFRGSRLDSRIGRYLGT